MAHTCRIEGSIQLSLWFPGLQSDEGCPHFKSERCPIPKYYTGLAKLSSVFYDLRLQYIGIADRQIGHMLKDSPYIKA